MAKLILSMDGLVLKDIPLVKERTTIGRKPHNDIQIDNLAVSGEHAVIVTILQDSFLEDLGSTNGTLVNGQSVKKHFLQTNDVVELGKYKLKYINEVTAQTKAADFEKTMVLRPGAMKAMMAAPAPAVAHAAHAAAAPQAPVSAAPAGKSFGDTMVNQGAIAPPKPPAPPLAPAAPAQAASAAPQKRGAIKTFGDHCGARVGVDKAAHHAWQARCPSGGLDETSTGIFCYPCGGGEFPCRQRQDLGCSGSNAQRS